MLKPGLPPDGSAPGPFYPFTPLVALLEPSLRAGPPVPGAFVLAVPDALAPAAELPLLLIPDEELLLLAGLRSEAAGF